MVWAIIAVGLGLRLYLPLNYEGLWGVDGGAYLEGLNALLGFPPDSPGFSRPPLAPGWLLYPFVAYWGQDTGYKIWSAVASLSPVVPVILFTRRLGGDLGVRLPSAASPTWIVPFAAGFVLLDLLHAEMLVTGALPLIAFGLLGTAWWAMCSLCERWNSKDPQTARDSLILAACIGLIPWVNQTTAGLALITLPIFCGALLLSYRGVPFWPIVKRLTPPMFVGGVVALFALPWYMDVLPGSGQLDYPGPVVYLTRAGDPAWLQMPMGVALGLLMIWKGQGAGLRALGAVLIVLSALTVLLSYDESVINLFFRSRYLMSIPFFIGVTWAVWRFALPFFKRQHLTPVPVALTLATVALMLTGYIMQVQGQSEKSSMISPETAAILEVMRRDHPGEGIITNSFTLSLWISALNRTPTFTTWNAEPPAFFTEDDKRVRCILGWIPPKDGCSPVKDAGDLGAQWVLIEGKFPWYFGEIVGVPGVYGSLDYEDPWADLPNLPWLTPAYQRGTTTVWRIHG